MSAFYAVFVLFGVASCDLSVSKAKDCGQVICDYLHYCSVIDNSCRPCRKICDAGGNQDVKLCDRYCQDYIHDSRYLKRDEVVDNAQEQIERLQVLSTISLIFSLIVFICLVFLIAVLWMNRKTKRSVFSLNAGVSNKAKKEKQPGITRNDGQLNPSEISTIRLQNDAVLNMQDIRDIINNKPISTQLDYTSMTTFKNPHAKSEPDSASSVYTNKTNKTTQPLAKRLPSEDSTLDFIYDNPALAPSPVLDKDKESSEGRKASGSDT